MPPVERYTHAGLTIEIHYDQDPPSPRDCDNLGTIIAWHSRYCLSDKRAPTCAVEDFDPTEYPICLPLYMFEHSGVALSTGAFSCPWDSGQVGWIYATRADLLKEYGVKRIRAKHLEHARGVLTSEVKEYGRYVNGECYGYRVLDPDGDPLDSCWGYIGDEFCKAEAEASATRHAAAILARADAAVDLQRSNN